VIRSPLLLILGGVLGVLSARGADDARALRGGFANPPEDAKLQMWWHWIGNHVSEEGIRADLKAMAEAGVSTAYVFAPNMGSLPPNALCMTDEWLRLFGVAIREAGKNGMKLGFHNCPGWSSSGGPWIESDNSMKVVVSSSVDIDPSSVPSVRLPQPRTTAGYYRDIAVYAFPVAPELQPEGLVLPKALGTKTPGTAARFELSYARDFLPRSLIVTTKDDRANGTLIVEAETRNGWMEIGRGDFSCWTACRDARIISLKPTAPVRNFRLSYVSAAFPEWMGQRDTVLTEVKLSELAFVENLVDANSSGNMYGYHAPDDRTAAGLDPGRIADVTPCLASDGTLDLARARSDSLLIRQSGNVRIVRVGCTSTGRGPAPTDLKGLECDKLDPRGVEAHWRAMPAKILALPGARDTVRYAVVDSYEVGGQNWTSILPDEFRKRRGYDLGVNLLSVCGYVIGDRGGTADFLWDYQRTVAELFAQNYFGRFAALCHENGLEAMLEPYGGPFDAIQCGRHADIPTGEFWLGRDVDGTPRLAASIAHLYGKARVAAESFTTDEAEGRWLGTPAEYRRVGDRSWLAGVNQIVFHSYVHQPWTNLKPGLSLGRHGSQFNRNTTWWPEARHWTAYVQRGQFLLQSGEPKTDVLTTFPGAHKDVVAAGYSYDYADEASLRLLQVRNGRVFMPGREPYEALSLHPGVFYSSETRSYLGDLERQGARLAWSSPLETARRFLSHPPVEAPGIRGIRRRLADGTLVYFLLNQSGKDFGGPVILATSGKPVRVSRFNAKTGVIEDLVSEPMDGGRIRVRIPLRADESAFVVLEAGAAADVVTPPASETTDRRVADLSSDWSITSFEGPNAPAAPLAVPNLCSWSESSDPRLRHFAGRAVYEKKVGFEGGALGKGHRVALDLGAVREIANVSVNGTYVGTLWEPPFCIDLTDTIPASASSFDLKVEVVNTWPNRLIGDATARKAGAAEPVGDYGVPKWVLEERADSGTGIFTWSNWLEGWRFEDNPIPAGLLGPVKLECGKN